MTGGIMLTHAGSAVAGGTENERSIRVSTSEIDTVVAWHRALNGGDVDRLLGLSSDDVEIGGPRGTGKGAPLLRDWATRAGISLEPRRIFHRAGTLVVEQAARWRQSETGPMTDPESVATVFLVREGRVTSVVRHPEVASALAAAGLDDSDEVEPR